MHENAFPRWLMVTLALAVLALLCGGAWFYHTQEEQLRKRAEDDLQAIAQLKLNQIVAWRADQLADAAVIAESPFFADGVAQWMANGQASQAEDILARFRSLQTH